MMKKIIKWTLFFIVLLGGIALAICYMVIPEQTKSAMDVVVEYANTPLGIVGGTTITLGLVASFVIKLVYDRVKDKAIQELTNVRNELEEQKNSYEIKLQDIYEKFNELLKDFEEKEKELENKQQELEEVLKLIPNKKVQERLGKINGREETTND